MNRISAVTRFMQQNTGDPFAVRAAIWELRDLQSEDADPADLRDIERSAVALNGVCSLHVNLLWDDALRNKPWWQRRRFKRTELIWKDAMHIALTEQANLKAASIGRAA